MINGIQRYTTSRRFLAGFVAVMACAGIAPPLAAEWSPTPEQGWVPLALGDLLVKPGSALDFSGFVEAGSAGQHGFITINAQGKFAFESAPEKSVRFFTASECMEYWPAKTPEEIAEYARQVWLGGYNAFRPHFLDDMLMINTNEDRVLNPVELDRWDRLSAALKKLGIYLYIDVSTSSDSFYAMPKQGMKRAKNLKTRLYWDTEARDHWEKAMRQLLEHVNPYTGFALKDEPQVVLFQLRNESGLHFNFFERGTPPDDNFLPGFIVWLEKKYTTIDALNRAWGTTHAAFSEIKFPREKGISARAADLQRFSMDTEVETFRWLKSSIEKVGIRVPVLDYNVGVRLAHTLSRSAMPMVDTHAYHDHPTAWISPGSSQPNRSSTDSGLDYYVWLNESRMLDRPFLVSEWGFPYWNQWRYEAGVGVPAYAALQDWQMLTHHSEPVRLRETGGLRPFKIAYDPPLRMSERMAAFFFARADVAPSQKTVEIQLDPEGVFTRMGGENYFTSALRKLPLMVKSGITVRGFADALVGAPVEADAVLRIHPSKREFSFVDRLDAEPLDNESMVRELRARGVLSAENQTDPAKGVYQSDTGELTLRMESKTIAVDTPRSKAVALPSGGEPVELDGLTVINRGESGVFFAGSLDGMAIKDSRRILIMAVGDAVNTGEIYEAEDRRVLKKLGTLPVLVKPLEFELQFKRGDAVSSGIELWSLAFNGDRVARLPVDVLPDGRVIVTVPKSQATELHYELVFNLKE